MKKSLKLLVLPAAMVLLTGNITSCSATQKEIAMISDVGDIDDGSFNQGCWEAVQKYGNEHNKSYDYYRPFADSEFARLCAVKQAVYKGAKVVIMPGFKFASTIITAADKYPDVKFVIADQNLSEETINRRNLISVTYDFEHSGWLAGYSVAKDYFLTDWEASGETKLEKQYGFAYYGGMPYNSVYPYGYGYIQGILYAANEFCVNHDIPETDMPFIDINNSYASVFIQDDMACAMTKGWLNSSTTPIKCVFSCGGKLYQSVTEAVKHYNNHNLPASERNFKDQEAPRNAARWIGVDANQYELVHDEEDKKCLYTSALKDVGHTVQIALDYYYAGKWDVLRNKMQDTEKHKETDPETGKEKEVIDKYGGFVVGLQSVFVDDTHETLEEKPYDYVGIPEDTKENSDVLVSFNKFTKDDLKEKILKLNTSSYGPQRIIVYTGLDGNKFESEKVQEESLGSGVPEFFNGNEYFLSDYNDCVGDKFSKDETTHLGNTKYPLSRYKIHCI